MKYYRVVCLKVSGKRKVPYSAKDIVSENDLLEASIHEYLKGGHIVEASKNEVEEWKKLQGMTGEDLIKYNLDQAKKAEESAMKELEVLKEEYSKLTGIDVDKINKTWGVSKLNDEIAFAKSKKNDAPVKK